MPIQEFVVKLSKTLPQLKTPLQLSGLAVIVAAFIATNVVSPEKVKALICAGAIGVVTLIFAQIFHFLEKFPLEQRAPLIFRLFVVFLIFILCLVVATAFFASTGTREPGVSQNNGSTQPVNLSLPNSSPPLMVAPPTPAPYLRSSQTPKPSPTVRSDSTPTISGKVTDESGKPISGVYMSITCAGNFDSTSTNSKGEYRYEKAVEGADCLVVPFMDIHVFEPRNCEFKNFRKSAVADFKMR